MARRTSDSLIYDTLRLEGSLFVPALLEKAARGEHTEQKAADYQLPKGLSLADEQGRAFRIACALWKGFESAVGRRDVDGGRATIGFASELFRDALGYADFVPCPGPIEIDARSYSVTAIARRRIAIVVAPHDLELDTPDERFAVIGSGTRRKSAYQLTQQFLNASETCVWALLTNGRRLRLVRDADTLTRPAFLEFDLEQILRESRYADFAALWRLLHASRAGTPEAAGDTCAWERWKREGEAQGERVRAGLRLGVTEALLILGNGFLTSRENNELRRRLESGELGVDAWFQQLLRLVYRFLFLFTVEERGLLHATDDSADARQARELYARGYALRRLRDRALRRAGFDRFSDLWTGVRIVFSGLVTGQPRLALPALGGLFSTGQCPDLDEAALDNRALLGVMRHLRWSSSSGSLAAVDYRNMGPEELGSVYESLLELVPTVDLTTRHFGFVGLTDEGSSDGNARKMSGSYYTPDSLVQELLDSALDPVIKARVAARPEDPAQALLEIAVIDPACGSAHFLLGAARRLAEKLAELRAVDGAMQTADYRHALREVIAHCIHGVDRNPMAIELARTALWLEGYEPGQPLSFLDHHLVCGDALLGLIDLKQLEVGIPNAAFKPLFGDDKEVCKALAAENRVALKTLGRTVQDRITRLFSGAGLQDALASFEALETMPETTTDEIAAKQAAYAAFLERAADSPIAHAADLMIAAFLTPKDLPNSASQCPTTQTLLRVLFPEEGDPLSSERLARARTVCREARVLHWPLAFARIFARGGFDCVLGNPPWEVSQLSEEEYFAARVPSIAALSGAVRKQAILDLEDHQPRTWTNYVTDKRVFEGTNTFYRASGRFNLTAVGKLNTYSLFAETIGHLMREDGRAGFIVPTGIATDDSTKDYFASLAEGHRLISLFDFENRDRVFPAIDSRTKFSLLTIGPALHADFAFYLTQTAYLQDPHRRFTLGAPDFRLINPNTRTCPVFRSQADAKLTKKIYRNVSVLIEEARAGEPEKNPWNIRFSQGLFNMTSASHLFLDDPAADTLPLYEAKMMHQFDNRWATYGSDGKGGVETSDVSDDRKADPRFAVRPRYWVREREVLGRLADVPRAIAKAWLANDESALLNAFANWIEAARENDVLAELTAAGARRRVIADGGRRFEALPPTQEDWRNEKAIAESRSHPPLKPDELDHLQSDADLNTLAHAILDRRSPKWLMGWRDICRATDERTVIASVLPRVGVGHTCPLCFSTESPKRIAAMLGNWNSLVSDYIARLKVGGTHLTYSYLKQFPVLPPERYTQTDLDYIVPRVLELTYTSHDLTPWAEDLGHTGGPFGFNPDRRARLRAELDARYARLYGLTRDELRYILDPADTHGDDYPSETFRTLKANEIRAHGEYRTRRLVLEAWDFVENT